MKALPNLFLFLIFGFILWLALKQKKSKEALTNNVNISPHYLEINKFLYDDSIQNKSLNDNVKTLISNHLSLNYVIPNQNGIVNL